MQSKKIKTMIVGADNGNGNFKGVFKINKVVYYEQPNVQAAFPDEIDTSEWDLDTVFRLADSLMISEKETVELDFGLTEEEDNTMYTNYFVGNSALERNEDIDQLDISDPNGKIHSDITTRGLSAYIAAELIKNECTVIKEENDGEFTVEDLDKIQELEVNVKLATAIPVRSYSNELANELAEKFKEKPYELQVFLPKGRKCNIKINYIEVDVTAEACSTTYFLQTCNESVFKEFNEKIELLNKSRDKKDEFRLTNDYFKDPENEILHLDIGEGTSEMPRTYGLKWNDKNSKGMDKGIGHASNVALKRLAQVEGTEHLRNQKQVSLALKNKNDKFMDILAQAINPSLRIQGNSIATEAIKEIKRSKPKMVVVYGGGSILLRKIIESKLEVACNTGRIRLLYIPSRFAVSLNALGLFAYADSESFKDISER